MRDLARYPITRQEVLACLADFARGVDPAVTGLVGDMRPVLLAKAAELIEAPSAPDSAPDNNDPLLLAKLLRAIANGEDAKASKHDIIFLTAAGWLEHIGAQASAPDPD